MHASSYAEMKQFIENYLDPEAELEVLDAGSLDVNGTYRPLFTSPKWKYTGIDLEPGPNVDVVSENPYRYPFADGTFDVVISGSVLEHVEDMYAFVRELARVMKPGGVMCVIAPWTYPEHKYPQDCWRVLPDGMRFLLGEIAGIKELNIYKNDTDCIGIAGVRQRRGAVAFGALVNDVMRLDMCLKQSDLPGSVSVIMNPDSATNGLNKLLEIMESRGAEVGVLVHQDMYFRQGWLQQALDQLSRLPASWVVAGIIGKDMEGNICGKFHDMRIAPVINTSDIHIFPQPASCFDECCIIVNLKKNFRFDERLDGFDLYGTLAVLQAWEMGGTAWIIDAYAEHYCMRPFTWFPDINFQRRFNWLHERFPSAPKIDSTVLGVHKKNEMAA